MDLNLTSVCALARPLQALNDGKPVTILFLGSAEGHSPVYGYIDANGVTRWGSTGEFQITQREVIPQAQAATARV